MKKAVALRPVVGNVKELDQKGHLWVVVTSLGQTSGTGLYIWQ